MVDPSEGPSITIPFALLPSKDEDKELVAGFAAGIKGEKYVETFGDMPHVRFHNPMIDLGGHWVKNFRAGWLHGRSNNTGKFGVWLTATSADLHDPKIKEEYKRGYETVLEFL